MLLFKLTTAFTLLALDTFSLLQWEHLLVLDSKFATTKLHVVQSADDLVGFGGRCEVGKRKTPKDSIIKMIVKGIGQRQVHVNHQLHELLLLDGERDILDNNGSRNELFVIVLCVWATWSWARGEDGRVLLGLRAIIPQLDSCQ